MGIVLSSNIDLQGGLPLDSRYGLYSSTTQANSSIVTANRFVGLTVGIVTGTTTYNGLQLIEAEDGVQEYWYYTGITDSDLVLKESEGGGFEVDGSTVNGLITYDGDDTGTAQSNITFDGSTNELSVTGNTTFNGVIYHQTESTTTVTNGNHNIYSLPILSGSTAEFMYWVEENTTGAFRAGKIISAVNLAGDTTVYYDNSTTDGVGSTEDIYFETLISGSNLILRAVTSNDTQWSIKIKITSLF